MRAHPKQSTWRLQTPMGREHHSDGEFDTEVWSRSARLALTCRARVTGRKSTRSRFEGEQLLRVLDWMLAKVFLAIAHVCYRREVFDALAFLEKRLSIARQFGGHGDFRAAAAALVAGEDRRFTSHFGVDTKGLLRAFGVYVSRREVQGASTITQQLVRVVTHDYRRSIRRKAKELCIACAADRQFAKRDQAELYLLLGYYGWRMNGLRQALDRLGFSLPLDAAQAASLVARLRYPEPATADTKQLSRIEGRAAYIASQVRRRKDEDGSSP